MRISIAPDNRRFVDSTGKPIFYLADTAWELLHRLTREEIDHYLRVRASQGFNAVHTVILSEFDGLRTPNAFGDTPFNNESDLTLRSSYIEFIEFVLETAQNLGMLIGLLPMWGDKVQPWEGKGPGLFDPAYKDQGLAIAKRKAREYAEYVARLFAKYENVVWINGGDRAPSLSRPQAQLGQEYWDVWNELGNGLREGSEGKSLISFHPPGGYSSSYWFHHTEWLDFNQFQSGHWQRDIDNYSMMKSDYFKLPVRPSMDGEPCYESHPVQYRPEFGVFDDYDVRKKAYHAVFAGAAGHVYGAHEVWQFADSGREAFFGSGMTWKEALYHMGASQMTHLRALIETYAAESCSPDDTVLLSPSINPIDSVHALVNESSRSALIYSTAGNAFMVNLNMFRGLKIRATWFSPRTGRITDAHAFNGTEFRAFVPPTADLDAADSSNTCMEWLPKRGNDWILILKSSVQ